MKFFNRVALLGGCALAVAAVDLPAQNLTVLHTFSGASGITNADGAEPAADLVLSGNTLYGTTPLGGTNGYGTVFSINTDGTGFTVLHAFTGNADGGVPQKNLVLSGGTLYGLAENGRNGGVFQGYGLVFSLSTNDDNFSVLYTFPTDTSGALGQPNPGLILSGGTLYGVAYQGGISNSGSIFSLDTNGTFQLLHLFNPGTDGKNPLGSLVLSGDTLYGTARNAGSNTLFGTVFSIKTNSDDFTVLHTFPGPPSLDGRSPNAGLILSGNTLYGTTGFGGTNNSGTVFAINTDGSGYAVLHSFNTATGEGKIPEASLCQRGNTLYGTTLGNGTTLDGTVFSVNTDGTSYTTLHGFSPANSSTGYTNADGSHPYGALAMTGNVLYSTTQLGGSTGNGTVFSLAVVPQITGVQLAGTNLLLAGINGLAGSTCTLLTSTNLALHLNQWVPVATNPLAGGGDFSFTATNAVTAGFAQQFYILQEQ